jgi:hypothetical protein
MIVDFGFLIWRSRDEPVGDAGDLAAAFVGIDSVVADGVLGFGRDVVNESRKKIGCLVDFEVALGVVVGFGAVDDGLGFGFPGDFLEREGSTKDVLIRCAHPSRGHPLGALSPLRSG